MEPSTDHPLATPAPTAVTTPAADPHVERITTDVTSIMDRAYLEQVSRTEPKAFLKLAAELLRMRAPDSNGRGNMVVNVVNAIPRSPLDGLPPGFTLTK